MIIFDFDGVLIDPIKELALSAYNLVTSLKVNNLEELPRGYVDLFYHNRHVTVTPNRIVALALWTIETLKSGIKTDISISKAELDSKNLGQDTKFTLTNFFGARRWLIEEYPANWLALNKPFERIWLATQNLDPNTYFILTNKDRTAVKKICNHYGLSFSDERLFTGEQGCTKQENLLKLDKLSPKDSDYILIDDAVENLIHLSPVLPGRIDPVLAIWGYGNEEDRLTAQNHGFNLSSEAEFVERISAE